MTGNTATFTGPTYSTEPQATGGPDLAAMPHVGAHEIGLVAASWIRLSGPEPRTMSWSPVTRSQPNQLQESVFFYIIHAALSPFVTLIYNQFPLTGNDNQAANKEVNDTMERNSDVDNLGLSWKLPISKFHDADSPAFTSLSDWACVCQETTRYEHVFDLFIFVWEMIQFAKGLFADLIILFYIWLSWGESAFLVFFV